MLHNGSSDLPIDATGKVSCCHVKLMSQGKGREEKGGKREESSDERGRATMEGGQQKRKEGKE